VTGLAGTSYDLSGTRLDAALIYGSGLRQDSDKPNGGVVALYLQLNLGATHHFENVFGAPLELSANQPQRHRPNIIR
jgi:hypothetical protein